MKNLIILFSILFSLTSMAGITPTKVSLWGSIPSSAAQPGDAIHFLAIASDGEDVEYQFLKSVDGGAQEVVQDWSSSNSLYTNLPMVFNNVFYVVFARGAGETNTVSLGQMYGFLTDIELSTNEINGGEVLTITHPTILSGFSYNVNFSTATGFSQTVNGGAIIDGQVNVMVPNFDGKVSVFVENIINRTRPLLLIHPSTVGESPVAAFTLSPNSGTAPLIIHVDASASYLPGFEDDPDRGIASCEWFLTYSTGEKKRLEGVNCIGDYTINIVGSFYVNLRVHGINDVTAIASKPITILPGGNQGPSAYFTFVEEPVGSRAVYFDASSSSDPDGNIVSYQWDFNDGSVGQGAFVLHTFEGNNSHNVTLTVTDNFGATASYSRVVGFPNTDPTANFSIELLGNDTFQFNGGLSSDPGGSIVAYQWQFGDNSLGNGTSVSHTYADDGTYQVMLTVTDNQGATASITKQVIIDHNLPPIADFSFVQITITSPYQFNLDASNSTDSDGEIVSYSWVFDDGGIAEGEQVSHAFAVPEPHSVTLTVIDNQGKTASKTILINVDFVNDDFTNPLFTNGSTSGWMSTGVLEIAKKCTFFNDIPFREQDCDESLNAAVISNSLDDQSLGELKQKFIVDATAVKLTGKIRFLTNELLPYMKSFDDMFSVSLGTSGGNIIIEQGSVSTTPLGAGVGGYQYATEAVPFEVFLLDFRTQQVSLEFKVLDVDDTIIDSAVVVTDLELVKE